MWAIACRRYLLALAVLAGVGMPSLVAQQDKPNFWITTPGLEVQASMRVVGASLGVSGSVAAPCARVMASEYPPFQGVNSDNPELARWHFVFEEVIPLDRRRLEKVADNRPLPEVFRNELIGPDLAWYQVYNEALRRSHAADMEMFKKSAAPNENIVYPNLKAMPSAHRGKIITVTGKLVVVREAETPRLISLEDLPKIYTGYINGPTKGAPPYAIAFTELPEEIKKPSENVDLQVVFHGYFLSLVSFPSEKRGQSGQKDVVYLVGKTVIVLPADKQKEAAEKAAERAEGDDGLPSNFYLIAAMLVGMVTVAILVALLNAWFRRGDRRIQAQLKAVRQKHAEFDLEPADTPPADAFPAEAPPEGETGIKPAEENEPRPLGGGGP